MATPLSDYLQHFGKRKPPIPPPEPEPEPVEEDLPAFEAPPEEDPAAQIEAAFERGREAGRAEALDECDLKLAEANAARDERIVAERQAWSLTEGAQLAGRLDAAVAALETALAAGIDRVLRRFIVSTLREQAVAALCGRVTEILSNEQAPVLRLQGPRDLLGAIQAALPARLNTMEMVETDAVDVSVLVDKTLIETQLGAWIAHLDKTAGDGALA
jgi:hypothetical protein